MAVPRAFGVLAFLNEGPHLFRRDGRLRIPGQVPVVDGWVTSSVGPPSAGSGVVPFRTLDLSVRLVLISGRIIEFCGCGSQLVQLGAVSSFHGFPP